jgi:diguanylate cyclase (GGDEF)-like protein
MSEHRLKILALARQALEAQGGSPVETNCLLGLLDILSASIEKFSTSHPEQPEHLVQGLFDNRALLAMLKQQANELDALRKLSTHLTSSLDLPDVLDAITSEAMRLIADARDVSIYLYKNKKLTFGASLDSQGNHNKVLPKPRMNGLTYAVARDGEILIVEDMRNHPLFLNAATEWLGSIIGLPLKVNESVVGVMNVSRTRFGSFEQTELQLLKLLSDQAAIAISNASLHQIVSRQAYSDTLTGLPNRRALDERLEEEVLSARKNDYSFAVVMMDLDGFKNVNDTYGHPLGDDVLRLVFNQMARGVRNTDFLARYGGDELTLILSQSDLSSALIVSEKITQGMRNLKFKLPDGKRLKLGISGGIAIYPVNARNGADLLRAADAALYKAKKYERGTFQVARGITGPLATHNIADA